MYKLQTTHQKNYICYYDISQLHKRFIIQIRLRNCS